MKHAEHIGPITTKAESLGIDRETPPNAVILDLIERVTALEQRLAKLQAGVAHIVSIPGIQR